jgi:hypothetical protein
VGAAVGILASVNATELPANKDPEIQLYGDINYTILVVSALLSCICNVVGILALEFFGDWAVRIEAHINIVVSALWLRKQEKQCQLAEELTHFGLYFLIISFGAMAAQKVSARVPALSIKTTTLIALSVFIMPTFILLRIMYKRYVPQTVIKEEILKTKKDDLDEFNKVGGQTRTSTAYALFYSVPFHQVIGNKIEEHKEKFHDNQGNMNRISEVHLREAEEHNDNPRDRGAPTCTESGNGGTAGSKILC